MKELISLARSAELYASQLAVKPDIHLDDHIWNFLIENRSFDRIDSAVKYYFYDGQKSARCLKEVVDQLRIPPRPGGMTMLEFASGYGCVTRHIKLLMPEFRSVACDIHSKAISFLRDNLSEEALLSCASPSDFKPNSQFDVVFALSFFSHMPRNSWGKWVRALYDTVADGGALIFTTQGLTSAKFFGNPAIPVDGFWFRADSEQKDLDASEYGQTIVTEQFVRATLKEVLQKEPLSYQAGFWWEHQDLYIVTKGR